jgi:ectoine hydroxylase-related dioxygenase (phytanoyl-CoA dioxygenase family)
MAKPTISDSDIEAFQRDGAVCLRGLFNAEWIETVRRGIEKTIADPSDMHRVAKVPGESGHFFKDYHMSRRLPEFRDFVFDSPAGPAAAALMRSSRINFFYDVLWIKEPGTSKPSAWHQDQPYHTVDGRKVCVTWLPLDPIDRGTSLLCIKGSHLWNRWFSPVWFENAYGGFDYDYAKVDKRFEKTPDFDAEAERHEFLSWEMELGDCIVFHGLTVHGAKGNPRLDRRRRALSTTWLGDDAVYAERPGKVQIETAHFGLKPGEPMDCPHCPRVWPCEAHAA